MTGEKMKAVVMSKGKLRATEVDKPEPGHHQLRVKLLFSGVCHTDVHMTTGKDLPEDLILGHEGVGIVDKLGPDCNGHIKTGQRVLVPWLGGTCGVCSNCVCGSEALCCRRVTTGVTVNGTYAEYTVINAQNAILVPENLNSAQAAPIACAGLTTYTGLKHSGLRAGQWVAVVGAAGGLGHLAVQYAHAMALKVIAIDMGAKKTDFLRKMAGNKNWHVIDGQVGFKGAFQQVENLVPGGVHGTLVLAPASSAYELALEITRPGGPVMCIALPQEKVPIDMNRVISKGLKLKGHIVGDRQDLAEALQFAAEGKVECVVVERPLEQADQVHDDLRNGRLEGRAVLKCCQGPCKGALPEEAKTGPGPRAVNVAVNVEGQTRR